METKMPQPWVAGADRNVHLCLTLKRQPLFGRDEGLSRSMVKTRHKIMDFALIDFHRF